MHNTILTALLLFLTALQASAQFYTITKDNGIYAPKSDKSINTTENKGDSTISVLNTDTITANLPDEENIPLNSLNDQKSDDSTSRKVSVIKKSASSNNLLELTIPNLIAEIKKNNIKYPKIVLAQAILETGWFKSSVCRNKHNLFGLTNPRTGKYYEFNHWTESVAAYYSKVQYRYDGGNYLLWLRDIGYAEDKGYIRAIIRVMKQLQ